jgi:hypothetical protein
MVGEGCGLSKAIKDVTGLTLDEKLKYWLITNNHHKAYKDAKNKNVQRRKNT